MNLKFAMDIGVKSKNNSFEVWGWGITEIGNLDNFAWGKDFSELIKYCEITGNHKIYCNNLKRNGKIIIKWLYINGYNYVSEKGQAKNKTFTSWIDDKGNIFSINIYIEKKGQKVKKITIVDSNKLINHTPKQIISSFGMDDIKYIEINNDMIDIDNISEQAVLHLKNNTIAIAKSLQMLFDLGLNKNTMASNAMREYIDLLGEKKFRKLFPVLPYEVDYEIRLSYKGGYMYTSPEYNAMSLEEKKRLVEWDIVSMYPHIMVTKPLPYGDPIKFDGKYPENSLYPLYIQNLRCNFVLKEGHMPTIQIKNSRNFNGTEYLSSSCGEDVELCLTSVDLELFFVNYSVYNIEYLGGYMFKASMNLFSDYVYKWFYIKEESQKYKNLCKMEIGKLMMNSLYGKFSINPNTQRKEPIFEDFTSPIVFKINKKNISSGIYIPVGTFITSYGRKRMVEISSIKKICTIKIDSVTLPP